jgi:hypothetical protein
VVLLSKIVFVPLSYIMKRQILYIAFLFVASSLFAEPFYTHVTVNNIRTLQVRIADNPLAIPVIELGSDQSVRISFDEMSYEPKSYTYALVHCNADWTRSSLSEVDYLEGFANGSIDNYAFSSNTTTLYVHYQFDVPNADLKLKVSGNYAVVIAQDNDFTKPVAVACFSVVQSRVTVKGSVRGNTDRELAGRYQQVDFEVGTSGYEVRDPFTELKVTVQQNRRWDNAVTNLTPTYTSSNVQSYTNNRRLIFEGGNQYRSVDFSSEYTYGSGIDRITFDRTFYHVWLFPSESRAERGVEQGYDANGQFLVNRQRSNDVDVEADYMWVHFVVPMPEPYFNGTLCLVGQLFNNQINEQSRMVYDFAQKAYVKSLFLKQGGYNFQYLFVEKDAKTGTLQPMEGSYWQTENEYAIYVYHRPWGERYDKLVAVKLVSQ